jgi:hypothetical protein
MSCNDDDGIVWETLGLLYAYFLTLVVTLRILDFTGIANRTVEKLGSSCYESWSVANLRPRVGKQTFGGLLRQMIRRHIIDFKLSRVQGTRRLKKHFTD